MGLIQSYLSNKSEYYNNYRGPNLSIAKIWGKNKEKEDITEHIKSFYGEDNNWNKMLYTYGEVFPDKINYNYYVEFFSDDGVKHWFYGTVGEKHQMFNPPLAPSFNQLYSS